jgi:hypothetical protein
MALKLPRTIRLDSSDTFVYARAAAPAEWAVTGTFLFFGTDPGALAGKAWQAFRGGFLGIDSFGWSTLVVVTEASAAERALVVDRLAGRLVAHCGAPDMARARLAAEEEVAFAQSLCDHPPNTLLGIHRTVEDDGIREAFRTLHKRFVREPVDAFTLVGVEEESPGEDVDLAGLARGAQR